ncbi:MAG: hypothetical protein MR510_16095 [Clostridium sp.]|uniref:hypothetical protein n=1 Tax=Clostridium sp. TaxID=1506 RepID=UPI0025EC8571|nr:hypothetical protein [Clostridium sp.]MCI6693964.1 hypothetical protein [Clostridium sp.]MDY2631628.1 hypothetical protein [Clostridium sp.]MDY6226682.1 hypothetical protein [Clostridium sp.]
MNCIEIDDILSTTVLYEGFSDYSEVLEFSKDSMKKLKEIANKYKNDYENNIIYNENYIYLDNDINLYLREFVYRFTTSITIEKLIYPLVNYDVISYKIIDLSDDSENLILSSEEINRDSENIEIKLNNIEVDGIKLKIKSKKNLWPKIPQIQIIKRA